MVDDAEDNNGEVVRSEMKDKEHTTNSVVDSVLQLRGRGGGGRDKYTDYDGDAPVART